MIDVVAVGDGVAVAAILDDAAGVGLTPAVALGDTETTGVLVKDTV